MAIKVEFINYTEVPMPRRFLQAHVQKIQTLLNRRKQRGAALGSKSLRLVFLPPAQMKALNHQFRGRLKVTDILSFSGDKPQECLGELLLCPQVLKKQAQAQGWPFRKELLYLTLHGILHLLGYDHESLKESQEMFGLQDDIFSQLF